MLSHVVVRRGRRIAVWAGLAGLAFALGGLPVDVANWHVDIVVYSVLTWSLLALAIAVFTERGPWSVTSRPPPTSPRAAGRRRG
jgi:hypothetical protein